MSHDHLKICHTQPSIKPALHGKCVSHNFWLCGGYGGGGEEGEEVLNPFTGMSAFRRQQGICRQKKS